MKTLIKNLLIPLAVFAMLTVGAFSINASEKTDNAVNTESVTDLKADDPYDGKVYIRIPNPSGSGFIFMEVTPTSEGDCSDVPSSERCTIIIDNEEHNLWGQTPLGGYIELYKL
ncbi:hypothetical protein HX033_17180 [Myroides odoratimimus]|uniref:hypothetical protein n=1 Tax=Myroides odoratimimus TaxID=76832 RepID=UPI002576574D|nr:hypothetical protein [Myroides odoratimimus]MDM1402397.1 hypothetical protein [Myroides odoratimimus]